MTPSGPGPGPAQPGSGWPGDLATPATPAAHSPAAHSPAEPGSGWPGDLATPATPVAHGPADVQALAAGAGHLDELVARQSVCRACPRLVGWRERVAAAKRRSFQDEPYWGRPIPGWGDPQPGILIVGLAPAAHGGNRTGRIFTGDRSGDFLFASLYRCGLAASPESTHAGDGQRLIGARMAAAVRCAPPANKPTPAERDTCAPWLVAELAAVAPWLRAIVCLGGFAWQAIWPPLAAVGFAIPRPRPPFGHGAEVAVYRDGQPRPGEAQPGKRERSPRRRGSLTSYEEERSASEQERLAGRRGSLTSYEQEQSASEQEQSASEQEQSASEQERLAGRRGSVRSYEQEQSASEQEQSANERERLAGRRGSLTSHETGVSLEADASLGQSEPLESSAPLEPGRPHRSGAGVSELATVSVFGCYHPSQQNTFTGRVTPEMLDSVFLAAVERLRS